jgi:hypothetical protein
VAVGVVVAAVPVLVAVLVAGAHRPAGAPGSPVGSAAPLVDAARPGLEPPAPGSWPADWPVLPAADRTKMSTVDNGALSFRLPDAWSCTLTGRGTGLVKYRCGAVVQEVEIGGDLLVRDCPAPCDTARRVELRAAVPAWGLRWVRDGEQGVWAESTQVDGGARYGLVFVRYWSTVSGLPPNRQLVFRVTGPQAQANELRMVANAVRDGTRPR